MVTYNFGSLTALADHFETLAMRQRETASREEKNRKLGYKSRAIWAKAEAAAYSNVTHVLRNSKIGEKPR